MNYKEVSQALDTITKALSDPEFQEWKESDELEYDYDQYAQGCADTFQEAEGFDTWALRQYVAEKLEQEAKP